MISAVAFHKAAQVASLESAPYAPLGLGGSARARRVRRRRFRLIAAPRIATAR
jgi:hypothetical protein